MLDDLNMIANRDPHDALGVAAAQPTQATWTALIHNEVAHDVPVETIVVAGMGGSALAAGLAKSWLRLTIPLEVVRKYDIPGYVNNKTLFIASSYSGNTEETLSALEEAETAGAHIVIVASGGQLIDIAQEKNYPFVQLPGHYQPRMAVSLDLRAIVKIFEAYLVVKGKYDEIGEVADWLTEHTQSWFAEVPTSENVAKQLAMHSAGKTPVIYSGSRMAPVGYKWKISFNENAKNIAFCNEVPEFDHNEIMGWTSHPVEKPFAVFDLISGFEHPQVLKRFAIADRLLSGMRPKSMPIELQGESVIAQMLWGCLLADFVSIYLAVLNGVESTQVDLLEKFKHELI
jgi:glucose/mannose-6-phosphate isomerase